MPDREVFREQTDVARMQRTKISSKVDQGSSARLLAGPQTPPL